MDDVRVGVDLVRTRQVEDSIRRLGRRYLERVFTSAEIRYAEASAVEMTRRLAARFAAKEAVIKLLRLRRGVDFREIEVRRMPGGWCTLALHGRAAKAARRARVRHFVLSLAHEDGYAIAMVVARCGPQQKRRRPGGRAK